MKKLIGLLLLSICIACTTSFLATGSVLAGDLYMSPVAYEDWKEDGNFFSGGFQGFVDYYSWLTPENRQSYKETGNYSAPGKFQYQSYNAWRSVHTINGNGKYAYTVIK